MTLASKLPCPSNTCDSSDAFFLYDDEEDGINGKCFSCGKYFTNNYLSKTEYGLEYDIKKIDFKKRSKDLNTEEYIKPIKNKKRAEVISQDDLDKLEKACIYDDTGFRSISEKTNSTFKVLSLLEECEVSKRYYPVTEDGVVVGVKRRIVDGKKFLTLGRNDAMTQLFGQHLWPDGGRKLIISGGEEDALAVYEMFLQDHKRRGVSYLPPASVSSSLGESGLEVQLRANFSWLEKFKEIVLIMDQDKAGKEAQEKCLKVLPEGRVSIVTLPLKDPSDMLQAGRVREFISAVFDARRYNPAGVIESSELYERIVARTLMKKLPLPPFAKRMQKAMAGGVPLGYIINILAASGVGKTSLVNEFIYDWIFNAPYRVGVVSLESDPDEYGELLLSRHIRNKLALWEVPEEKHEYVTSEYVKKAADELFIEDGGSRFSLVDHQGGIGGEELKKKCEYLVKAHGCKILVIDPLTLALTGASNEGIDEFMSWEKNFISANNIIIANIVHVRKAPADKRAGSKGGEISEESAKGSGSIFQVAGCNILMMRDKEAEDEITRNTTRVVMSKCRWTGNTGVVGDWYYDNSTHTLHDSEEFFAKEGRQVLEGNYTEDNEWATTVFGLEQQGD